MTVGLLSVVEDQSVRVVTQEPDLDVERLPHVTQRGKLDKTEVKTDNYIFVLFIVKNLGVKLISNFVSHKIIFKLISGA